MRGGGSWVKPERSVCVYACCSESARRVGFQCDVCVRGRQTDWMSLLTDTRVWLNQTPFRKTLNSRSSLKYLTRAEILWKVNILLLYLTSHRLVTCQRGHGQKYVDVRLRILQLVCVGFFPRLLWASRFQRSKILMLQYAVIFQSHHGGSASPQGARRSILRVTRWLTGKKCISASQASFYRLPKLFSGWSYFFRFHIRYFNKPWKYQCIRRLKSVGFQ